MYKKVAHTIYHQLGKRRRQLPVCLADNVQVKKLEKIIKLDIIGNVNMYTYWFIALNDICIH